jgi:hypothetical protein
MSTFNLTNTATQVDTAIQAVVGADTAPTDASVNMVTSGGVKTYVDNAVGDLGSKTVTTESVGIASTDNDTSVPTSAAVKDYVDNTTGGISPFNSLRLFLLPSDFVSSSKESVSYKNNEVAALTRIPLGYKVTNFTYSTDASNNTVLTVNEHSISNSSSTLKGTKTAKGSNLVLDITDVTGSDTNYLSVTLDRDHFNSSIFRYYYGGYFTLVKL